MGPRASAKALEREVEALYAEIRVPERRVKELRAELEDLLAETVRQQKESGAAVAKRIARLHADADKLLDLFLEGDIDRGVFRERKARVAEELEQLEAGQHGGTQAVEEVREVVERALRLARNCQVTYREASPETRRLFNQAVFAELVVRERKIVSKTYEEPFRSLVPNKVL